MDNIFSIFRILLCAAAVTTDQNNQSNEQDHYLLYGILINKTDNRIKLLRCVCRYLCALCICARLSCVNGRLASCEECAVCVHSELVWWQIGLSVFGHSICRG